MSTEAKVDVARVPTHQRLAAEAAAQPVVQPEPTFLVRPAIANDRAYIEESWLNSYRSSARAQDAGACYMREHKGTIRGLMARSSVVVAHVPDCEDAILGFAVYEPFSPGHALGATPVVHYVFVRQGARRTGIAHALIGDVVDVICDYTHRPARSNGPMNLPPLWRYNPYRIQP